MKPLLLALAKALLQMALDRATRAALPKIFERVDQQLPPLLNEKAPPIAVELLVYEAVTTITGKRPQVGQVDAVLQLYNPLQNAIALRKRP